MSIPSVPVLRTFLNARHAVRKPMQWFGELLEEYGSSFYVRAPNGNHLLFTADADLIRHVFQTKHRNFTKTPVQTVKLARFLGHGLLTLEGDRWLRQRRLIQPGFHREKLSALIRTMNSEIDEALPPLEKAADSGSVVDMSGLMMRLTFNIVSSSLFTTAVAEKDLDIIEDTIDAAQKHLITTVRRPWVIPWYKLSGRYRMMDKKRDLVDAILTNVIRTRKEGKSNAHDLLQMLLDARYEDSGEGMTERQLSDETMVLYAAGHETSSNGLSWLIWLLSNHPDVVAELELEIEQLGNRTPGFEDLPNLPLSGRIVMEGLRMRPPAWLVDRLCVETHEWNGHTIEKGQRVLMYLYGLHHNAAYWNSPSLFDPGRFTEERFTRTQKQAYLPFGAGPRQCIGASFAQMEMQLVLLRLFDKFRFQYAGSTPPELKPMITLQPSDGMPMRVFRK